MNDFSVGGAKIGLFKKRSTQSNS